MKLCFLLILSVSLGAFAQTKNVDVHSSGTCSPNIVETKERASVTFTCNTSLDPTTTLKIVSLLNQLLAKNQSDKDLSGINEKLDQILRFIQGRRLTTEQITKLISILRADGQHELYFVFAPDAESTHYGNQIYDTVNAGGWKIVPIPPNFGTVVHYPEGIVILVSDPQHPPMHAIQLQQAFAEIGIETTFGEQPMVGQKGMALMVGLQSRD